jgi:hypothetical protein
MGLTLFNASGFQVFSKPGLGKFHLCPSLSAEVKYRPYGQKKSKSLAQSTTRSRALVSVL